MRCLLACRRMFCRPRIAISKETPEGSPPPVEEAVAVVLDGTSVPGAGAGESVDGRESLDPEHPATTTASSIAINVAGNDSLDSLDIVVDPQRSSDALARYSTGLALCPATADSS